MRLRFSRTCRLLQLGCSAQFDRILIFPFLLISLCFRLSAEETRLHCGSAPPDNPMEGGKPLRFANKEQVGERLILP